MTKINSVALPRGIVSVVQTPFAPDGSIDLDSLGCLLDDAIAGGVSGLLAPVVASEVACLSVAERIQVLQFLSKQIAGRVPLIVGASSDDVATCHFMQNVACDIGAAAWLVAVPQAFYQDQGQVIPFFRDVCTDNRLPLIIQDLQFGGPGLPLSLIRELRMQIPAFQGIKIETVPAGPKYTEVRRTLGVDFFIAGGWAVSQLIEALDRGVDAMIPESAMVRVYCEIFRRYACGDRDGAQTLFRSLLPILAFTNQELSVSIAFFKRLLVRKGIFENEMLRLQGFVWDEYNQRIADELIEHYLTLEAPFV